MDREEQNIMKEYQKRFYIVCQKDTETEEDLGKDGINM
jgi:hypothetical protein